MIYTMNRIGGQGFRRYYSPMVKLAEQIVSDAIDYIVAHWQDQPDLDALARRAGYDPTHFQKTFTQMVGLSPKKLGQFLHARHAREFLLSGHSTLNAAYAAGLSGNGRLHDLFVTLEAATPGEIRKKGAGLLVRYAFHPTPIGDILIAETDRGLCWLGFVVGEDREIGITRLRAYWPNAEFIQDAQGTSASAEKIIGIWRGDKKSKLNLHLHGTNFQLQVWHALMKIPCGATVSYQTIAHAIDRPKASRAVGSAVGANPVSLLIPCHRVIQGSGIVENYGWGTPRKKLILALESGDTVY
ncbi:MAG: methylated-DNA-[]-cysteine S-methyltransferase family protein [Micavibrio sp.]|nr:methylated-DNA-[]-cysteine S-methyltransferase family protein [Micavibrio sp.]